MEFYLHFPIHLNDVTIKHRDTFMCLSFILHIDDSSTDLLNVLETIVK
jgi:hypothetical protein